MTRRDVRIAMIKIMLSTILILTISAAGAQSIQGSYRTVREPGIKPHHLTLTDGGKCTLTSEVFNHTQAMVGERSITTPLSYKIVNDTLTFSTTTSSADSTLLRRLLAAKFVMRDKHLYDCVSGYTYVDQKAISNKYMLYVLNGKHYKQRMDKVDGYGLVLKSQKVNREFEKDLNELDLSKLTVRTLTGRKAFDKYGVLGMNGVYEVEKKK